MMGTFLRHHPGWDGQLVVIHDDGLCDNSRDCLTVAFPNITFETVSPELTTRIDQLVNSYPDLGRRGRRIYSLEVCRFDFDSLLYEDSDVLIHAPLDDLFERPEPFLAAPDGPSYTDCGRNPKSYDPVPHDQMRDDTLLTPFNSGLMRFDFQSGESSLPCTLG